MDAGQKAPFVKNLQLTFGVFNVMSTRGHGMHRNINPVSHGTFQRWKVDWSSQREPRRRARWTSRSRRERIRGNNGNSCPQWHTHIPSLGTMTGFSSDFGAKSKCTYFVFPHHLFPSINEAECSKLRNRDTRLVSTSGGVTLYLGTE